MLSYSSIQLDFLEQCMIGDEWKVKAMLRSNNVDISYHHPINGWTALHWAARRGHEAICLILLQAGFSREVHDINNKTPWEVCSPAKQTVREILRPESVEEDMLENTASDSHGNGTDSNRSEFVPSFIQHPPFPYSGEVSSFDYGAHLRPTPSTPSNNSLYFSYGRRDLVNRTRFLLVRTSCGEGKEAFKRITLPGGSTVEQLRKTINKAMKCGRVNTILTLPDMIIVEDDSQVACFTDCQKIHVIFGENETFGDAGSDQSTSEASLRKIKRTVQMNHSEPEIIKEERSLLDKQHLEHDLSIPPRESEVTKEEKIPRNEQAFHVNVDIPSNDANISSVQFEGESLSDVGTKYLKPILSNDSEDEGLREAPPQEGTKPIHVVRNSADSDPGDYVKVEREETKNDGSYPTQIAAFDTPTIPHDSSLTITTIPENPVTVMEKSDGSMCRNNRVSKWLEQNSELVRHLTTAAAVMGVASVVYFIYARKLRSSYV